MALFTLLLLFFFNDTATTEIYTLSLHDALPISLDAVHAQEERGHPDERASRSHHRAFRHLHGPCCRRSEEHTSELQSRLHLVCRLLLEKKKLPARSSTWERISYHSIR